MENDTIFYSFRLHNISEIKVDHLSLVDVESLCIKSKDNIINLLSQNGISTYEIIRPEIYKHNVSFTFLPNFKFGSIHLIFKPFEYIRILKNAYNISIISWKFDSINVNSLNNNPFTNHKKMLLLVDEIWLYSNKERDILNQNQIMNTYIISKDDSEKEVSWGKILNRINYIKRKLNE